jgi:hypothetical protein
MVSFQAHLELLHLFLARRDEIVARIEPLLNAQRRPIDYLQNGPLLGRQFEDCFFTVPGLTHGQTGLRGQLEEAHWSSGFRPREIPGLHNGPADAAELMMRAFYLWRQTRWPGRNGRLRYAHTLFNLHLIRCLELLSMRLWDGEGGGGERLAQIQGVLDRLWSSRTADQPALVRDARWLVPLAQSLATDDLGAYFRIAEGIAETLPERDRLEIHKAGVRMTGGHLRSQIRFHATKNEASLDDASLLLITRTTNALDFALLIQELVPLLDAYERACERGDRQRRLELADAICQGISPDPELFVNRVELLGPYSMIEHLFITTEADRAVYTAMGQRHVQLVHEYSSRIARIAKPLADDCSRFRPTAGAYSPYGVLYGFSSDLLKHMALKASQPDAMSGFGLEDVFNAGGRETLAWASGWRKLPHLPRDVQAQFDYPQQFAEDVFNRIEQALRTRVANDDANTGAKCGRLFIAAAHGGEVAGVTSELAGLTGPARHAVPDLPARYVQSSDRDIVAAGSAEWRDQKQIMADRLEGKFLLSYQAPGGWIAISKTVLTEVLGTGHSAKVVGLPPAPVDALTLLLLGELGASA